MEVWERSALLPHLRALPMGLVGCLLVGLDRCLTFCSALLSQATCMYTALPSAACNASSCLLLMHCTILTPLHSHMPLRAPLRACPRTYSAWIFFTTACACALPHTTTIFSSPCHAHSPHAHTACCTAIPFPHTPPGTCHGRTCPPVPTHTPSPLPLDNNDYKYSAFPPHHRHVAAWFHCVLLKNTIMDQGPMPATTYTSHCYSTRHILFYGSLDNWRDADMSRAARAGILHHLTAYAASGV